jgi:hypothetical protein
VAHSQTGLIPRHQSVHDIHPYDVCKDILRIEDFCQRFGATGGVLILTNDPAYWSNRRRSDTFDATDILGATGVDNGVRNGSAAIGKLCAAAELRNGHSGTGANRFVAAIAHH